jgi:hypothetical protein
VHVDTPAQSLITGAAFQLLADLRVTGISLAAAQFLFL